MTDCFKTPLSVGEGFEAFCMAPVPGESDRDIRDFYKTVAVLPQQTHSTNVRVVGRRPTYKPNEVNKVKRGKIVELTAETAEVATEAAELADTDGVISFTPGMTIGVVTADCVPILVYADDVRAVAALHAGWKGTLNGIVETYLDMLAEYGADPRRMQVVFGPSISKERYEVDQALADRFVEAGFGSYVSYPSYKPSSEERGTETPGKPHIDLQGVNIERFLRRGVPRENIIAHPGCTYGSRNQDGQYLYPSHRRSGGAPGRLLSSITLRAEGTDTPE